MCAKARAIIKRLGGTLQYMKNQTPNKKELSPKAREVLRANMTLEYEFYQFVKQRLRKQKRSIGLMGKLMQSIMPKVLGEGEHA